MSASPEVFVFNETPVGSIVAALNLKCAAAGRKQDFEEAKRLADLAFAVEDAIKEVDLTSENAGKLASEPPILAQ